MPKCKIPYKVKWEIEIEAYNDMDAAELALEIQKDPNSLATCFEITRMGSLETVKIDLNDGK